MASEGVEKSDARISNTRAVKNLRLVYLSITPPHLSMMLIWTYSVDLLPLTFLTFARFSLTTTFKYLAKHYFFRGSINNRIQHGIDNTLNETSCTNYHFLIYKNRLMVLCNFVTLFDIPQNTNNDKTRQSHKSKWKWRGSPKRNQEAYRNWAPSE